MEGVAAGVERGPVAPPHPASRLLMPPAAHRAMHAHHDRPPLPADARVDSVWIWLLVVAPWLFASTIYLFSVGTVLDALWIGDLDAAIGHVTTHLAIVSASSLTGVAVVLLSAFRDARGLRAVGVVKPFPWAFALLAGIVYLIGRHVVLRRVTRPSPAPLVVSIVLYALFYTGFAVWAANSLSEALAALG